MGLLLAALLGVHQQAGVVDRIEGDWAVVEWPDRTLRDTPTALFEQAPSEGCSVRLWLLAHPRGPWRLHGDELRLGAGEPPLDFTLPAPPGAPSDRRFVVVLTVVPPPENGVAADLVEDGQVVAGGPDQPQLLRRRK
jgi:hypothetical protein